MNVSKCEEACWTLTQVARNSTSWSDQLAGMRARPRGRSVSALGGVDLFGNMVVHVSYSSLRGTQDAWHKQMKEYHGACNQ